MIVAAVKDMDRGFERILRETKALASSFVVAGWPGNGPKVKDQPDLDMAGLAAIHEFGSHANNIPSRPMLKQTAESQDVQRRLTHREIFDYSEILTGRKTASTALSSVGAFYAGEIQETITRGDFVKLQPATIARKKSSAPLIDTGAMRASVAFKVRKGKA